MICCPQMPSHNFIKRTFYMLDFLYTNTLLKCGLLWKKFAFCIRVLEMLFNMDYGPYTEQNSIRSGVLFWGFTVDLKYTYTKNSLRLLFIWLSLTNEIKPRVRRTNQLLTIWNPQTVVTEPNSIPKMNVFLFFLSVDPNLVKNQRLSSIVHVTIADK